MHENFDKEEEIHVSSNRSFGIVFTFVFLAVGAWMISVGRTERCFFLAVSIFLFIVTFLIFLKLRVGEKNRITYAKAVLFHCVKIRKILLHS